MSRNHQEEWSGQKQFLFTQTDKLLHFAANQAARNGNSMNDTAPLQMPDAMICRYFKVAHRDMVFLKFILEAYEGMNVMSTVDNKGGIIRIAIMPGFVEDMDALLADLGRQVLLEPVEWPHESCTF
jgi:hypothetical protein